MKLTRVAIDNYRFTIIQYAAFLILGLGAISTMPYSEDPPLDPAGTTIIVYYPGTSPIDLERQIVEPLEEAVNEIEDIKHIATRMEDGTTKISVEFESYVDSDEKYREVREQVNKVRDRLPPHIAALNVIQWSTSNTRIMQLALISENASYHELYDEAQHIKRNLERVSNVKQVEILGDPDEIVEINIDLERLAHYGLGISHVTHAIHTHNTAIPGGAISVGTQRFTIKTSGLYTDLNDIRRTVLQTKGSSVLYLSDVATVEFGYREHLYKTRFNGKRCLFIGIKQKKNSDIFLIVETIRDRLETLQKEMPPGMQLTIGFDQAESVASRIHTFTSSLGQGIFLVGIVIFLVVGARASFIVMIAIPASFVIGIGFVYLTGYGIHQITITGFIIALGLLVDNAIVVVESVVRYQREGASGRDAAIKGVNLIALPIASSTLTTVLAFVPIIFLSGSTGDFIRSLPITVIYTLSASLFVALTLTPLLASRLMSKSYREPKTHRLLEHFVAHQYQPILQWCLRHHRITIFLTTCIFILSLSLFPLVGVSFFPKAEKPMIMIDIDMPRGTDLPTTDRVVKTIEKTLLNQPEITKVMANAGRGNPQVYYNMNLTENKPHVGQIFAMVDLSKGRTVEQIIDDLRSQFDPFPTGRIRVWEFKQGPSSDPPIYIRIQGDNLETLSKLAKDVEDIILNTPGTIYIDNPLKVSKTNLQLHINRDKAHLLGLTPIEIDQTVATAIAGLTVSKYRDAGGTEYDLVLRLNNNGEHPTVNILEKIALLSHTGQRIPLQQVAAAQLRAEPPLITRYDLKRTANVTADVTNRTVNAATQDIIQKLEAYPWPPGYRYIVGGEQETRQSSFGGLAQAVVIALVCIYGVLILQFKSFIQPFVIFSAIPLAIIGSIFALLITGYSFSFSAFLGITSLVGIVINDAILLVDFINLRREEGIDRFVAIQEAGIARFVPVVLTSATTIGGLLPLTLGGGSMWAPMGWGIIGGLFTATFLTLLVVPVLYVAFTPKTTLPRN